MHDLHERLIGVHSVEAHPSSLPFQIGSRIVRVYMVVIVDLAFHIDNPLS